jgi:hypothetical protein
MGNSFKPKIHTFLCHLVRGIKTNPRKSQNRNHRTNPEYSSKDKRIKRRKILLLKMKIKLIVYVRLFINFENQKSAIFLLRLYKILAIRIFVCSNTNYLLHQFSFHLRKILIPVAVRPFFTDTWNVNVADRPMFLDTWQCAALDRFTLLTNLVCFSWWQAMASLDAEAAGWCIGLTLCTSSWWQSMSCPTLMLEHIYWLTFCVSSL